MAEYGFGKCLRLLTAADYKTVFGQASYKVSCPQLLILAVPNGQDLPRLGLVIAKKNVRQATQRNRIKRLLRESFRMNQNLLAGLDIVILARAGVDKLDNKAVSELSAKLWQDLIRRRNRQSTR